MSFEQFQWAAVSLMAIAVAVGQAGCWRISRRAGLPGWSSLIVLIPILNVTAIYWLAFRAPRALAAGREQERKAFCR